MVRPIWIGDTVHYVLESKACRPALITDMKYPGASHAHLQVFLDGPIYEDNKPPQRALWMHEVPHSKILSTGHWHTMQECPYLLDYIQKQNAPTPMISDLAQQDERKPDESNSTNNTVTQHGPPERPLPKPLGSKSTLEDAFNTGYESPGTRKIEPIKPGDYQDEDFRYSREKDPFRDRDS